MSFLLHATPHVIVLQSNPWLANEGYARSSIFSMGKGVRLRQSPCPLLVQKKRTGCDMRIDRKRSFSIDNSRYTRHEDDRLQRGRVNWLAPLNGPDAFWLASA